MSKRQPKKPTEAELEILHVMWGRGSATVREIFREISEKRSIGYSTVLKQMQIMFEKGTLRRDESVRPQVYRAARSRNETEQQMVGDLLDRLFSGSPGNLVMQALSSKKTTPEEREQIRQLLDDLEVPGS